MSDIREFRTKAFLDGAVAALAEDGFVTDEHIFAPYRDVLLNHVEEVQAFLSNNGNAYDLGAGEVEVGNAGPIFYIFDKSKLSSAQAEADVRAWVSEGFD